MATWTSKLGGKFPRELIEKLDAEHHRELQRLRKLPKNACCAECGEGNTTWASVNLGVFLCTRCSDVHRALGTHISKVKGCSGTYLWGPDEMARMREWGNALAAAHYSAAGAPMPEASASKEERVELCRRKYEELRWAAKDAVQQIASKVVPSVWLDATTAEAVAGACTEPRDAKVTSSTVAARPLPTPLRSSTSHRVPPVVADLINIDDATFDGLAEQVGNELSLPSGPKAPGVVAGPGVAATADALHAAPALARGTEEGGARSLDSFLEQCLTRTHADEAAASIGADTGVGRHPIGVGSSSCGGGVGRASPQSSRGEVNVSREDAWLWENFGSW
jgi:hypothetical protein